MALTEHKRRTTRRLRWQNPWHERRRSDSSARCSAVEKTFSRAAGRVIRQESPAIRRLVRTSGITCCVRKRRVRAQAGWQAVLTAVSMLSFPSPTRRSRSILKAFMSWEYTRSSPMRPAGFLPQISMMERGGKISHRFVKRVGHTTFLSRSSDRVPETALTLGSFSPSPFPPASRGIWGVS